MIHPLSRMTTVPNPHILIGAMYQLAKDPQKAPLRISLSVPYITSERQYQQIHKGTYWASKRLQQELH